ncbi:MAG: outer membrane protein transport protein [Candidatus Binatia bacterium]|nr:outer membrane protein transport protein [Candidatus Binatia bacterium]
MAVSAGVLLGGLSAGESSAGGLAVNEASARLTGTGYAGTAALAEDASMAWYNPAGLTRLEGGSAVFSGSAIQLDTTVEVQEATTWGQGGITGAYGSMEASGGGLLGVPNFHVAQKVHDKVALYLGVVAPWGDQTNFSDDSAVRYLGTLSQLRTIDINPAIAIGPWEGFSVGLGFNAQNARGRFNQQFALPTRPVLEPGDINAQIKVDDWGYGWNAGVLYEYEDVFRIGVGYRSAINHDLGGEAKFRTPALPAGLIGGLPEIPSLSLSADAAVNLAIPQSVTVSGVWNITDWVQVLGDLQWTGWSSFQSLDTSLDNYTVRLPGSTADTPVADLPPALRQITSLLPAEDLIYENFRDTWRATVGFQFFPSDKLTLRLGGGFDQSPVHNANRTLRLPDANRWILSTGFGVELLPGIYADFGYAHYFVGAGLTRIDETNQTLDASSLTATVESAANVFALQLTYNWKTDPWSDLEIGG